MWNAKCVNSSKDIMQCCYLLGVLRLFRHGLAACTMGFEGCCTLQAYLQVGPQVSCYPEYREVMVQHLIGRKLGHWDRALRELTSKALAMIVPQDPAYFSSSVLGQLLDLCGDPCIEVGENQGLILCAHSSRQGSNQIATRIQYELLSCLCAMQCVTCLRHFI